MPLGNRTLGPVPSLSRLRSVVLARSGGCSFGPDYVPCPSPPFLGDSAG